MQTTRTSSTTSVCLYAALAAIFIAGCGKQSVTGRVPVIPVTGKVIFEGQATPGALVVFHPVQDAQSASPPAQATVRDDGMFELTTYTANDGAPPGEYKVTVEWRKLINDNGDVRPGPNVLPDRYSRPKTTDLVARVSEGPNQLPTLQVKR